MSSLDKDRWWVGLAGSEDSLLQFASFDSSKWMIREENGKYFLASEEFESCSTSSEVRGRAAELLHMVMGIFKLQFGYVDNVRIDGVIKVRSDGIRSLSVSRTILWHTLPKSSHSPMAEPDLDAPFQEICAELIVDPSVAKALRFYSEEDRWTINLWKVYETIRADVADRTRKTIEKALGESGVRWITLDEFNRFGTVINNPNVSGDEARHAEPDPRRDPHSNPMSREEAEALVRRLLVRWLNWRYNNKTRH